MELTRYRFVGLAFCAVLVSGVRNVLGPNLPRNHAGSTIRIGQLELRIRQGYLQTASSVIAG